LCINMCIKDLLMFVLDKIVMKKVRLIFVLISLFLRETDRIVHILFNSKYSCSFLVSELSELVG